MYSKMRYISDRQWECRLPLCLLVSGYPEGKRKKAPAAASAGGSWRLRPQHWSPAELALAGPPGELQGRHSTSAPQ